MLSPRITLLAPPAPGLLEGASSGLFAIRDYVAFRDPSVHVEVRRIRQHSSVEVDKLVHAGVRTTAHIVGITTTTATYQAALTLARSIKALRSDIRVVFGGPHASAQDELLLNRHPEVDAVVRGEGEIAMSYLARQGSVIGRHVPNLTFRSPLGIRRAAEAPRLGSEDLDRLTGVPDPSWLEDAPGKFGSFTYVSARGCPLACSFCSVASQAVRAKSVAKIVGNLRDLVLMHGATSISIEDNFFAHSLPRTLALCDALTALREEIGSDWWWDCQTRVESVKSQTVVDALARAGCRAVYLGVESFNDDQLRFLGKTARPDEYVRQVGVAVGRLTAARIDCYLNLQVGLPGESARHHARTVAICCDLGERAHRNGQTVTIFPMLYVLYPGTQHFQAAVADGVLPVDVFESFTEWEARALPVRRWLGEHFAHGTGGIPMGILDGAAARLRTYRLREDAVAAVAAHLGVLAAIPGVRVFKYREFLYPEQLSV